MRSGQLSYPRLRAPFDAAVDDNGVPFGHDVQSQQALVERPRDGQDDVGGRRLIARLLAGDGFYGPQQGAEVVADCVVALFYDDHEIDRTDTRREAITVDGHEAYLIESHLTFDIPASRQGRDHDVVVVDVGATVRPDCSTAPSPTPRRSLPHRSAGAGRSPRLLAGSYADVLDLVGEARP